MRRRGRKGHQAEAAVEEVGAIHQLPPPPPHLPYQPRHTEAPLPSYPPRHGEGLSALPGPLPLPYLPRSAGFPGQQLQHQQPPRPGSNAADEAAPAWKRSKDEFKDEVWRLMTGIARMVEPLTDKNGFFPYHLFLAQ